MYIECTLDVTLHTALSVQAWQQCSGNAHLGDPSGRRQATGHRPCFRLRCVDVPYRFRRISIRRGWDFLVVKWLWNGCEMLWIFCVNHWQSLSIRQGCGPQIRIAHFKILQKQKQGKIDQLLSHATSCYVSAVLCTSHIVRCMSHLSHMSRMRRMLCMAHQVLDGPPGHPGGGGPRGTRFARFVEGLM